MTTVHTDSNDDGIQDSVVNTIEQPNGVITTEWGATSSTTTIEKGTITNNDNGTQTIKYEVDKYGDAKVVINRTDIVDAKGNAIKSSLDTDNNGVVDTVVTREFDEKGNAIKEIIDYPGEKSDRVITNTYNDKGENIKSVVDYNMEDKNDHIIANTFNDEGLVTSYTMDYPNSDGLRNVTNTFDDKGRVVKVLVEHSNGNENLITYEYAEHGQLLKSVDSNNIRDYIQVYNEKEQKIEFTYDSKQDDGKDYSIFYGYDDKGDNSTLIYDNKMNDNKDYTFNNQFDDEHHRILGLRDDLSDGSFNKLYLYESMSVTYQNDFAEVKDIYFAKDDIDVTISEAVLNKIIGDDSSDKVVIHTARPDGKLHLDGNFTKTAETESHGGQDYVKYTDEAGNALIVDPDITVDII